MTRRRRRSRRSGPPRAERRGCRRRCSMNGATIGRHRRDGGEDRSCRGRPTPISWLKSSARTGRPAEPAERRGPARRPRSSARAAAPSSRRRRPCRRWRGRPSRRSGGRTSGCDVATPSFVNGTAFWTTIVNTDERRADAEAGDEHPEPDDRHRRVRGSWVISSRPTAMIAIAPTSSALYLPVRRHDQARHDRAADQADEERQERRSPSRRADALRRSGTSAAGR